MEDVDCVHAALTKMLAAEGVRLEKIYVAPEAPDAPSRGRKPSPQFLLDARDEFQIDLSQSYFIGDKLIDLQCGWNAGVKKSILVRTGYGSLRNDPGGRLRRRRRGRLRPPPAAWILQTEASAKTTGTR